MEKRYSRFSENWVVMKSWKQLCKSSVFVEFCQVVLMQLTEEK